MRCGGFEDFPNTLRFLGLLDFPRFRGYLGILRLQDFLMLRQRDLCLAYNRGCFDAIRFLDTLPVQYLVHS